MMSLLTPKKVTKDSSSHSPKAITFQIEMCPRELAGPKYLIPRASFTTKIVI